MKIRPFYPFCAICEQQYRNFLTSSLLGHNQLFGLRHQPPAPILNQNIQHFWDGKMKFRQLPTCGSYKRTDTFFSMQTLHNCSFFR